MGQQRQASVINPTHPTSDLPGFISSNLVINMALLINFSLSLRPSLSGGHLKVAVVAAAGDPSGKESALVQTQVGSHSLATNHSEERRRPGPPLGGINLIY